jgi:hypothetical protein
MLYSRKKRQTHIDPYESNEVYKNHSIQRV